MKQSSLIYYAILLYIFIILSLYLYKPDVIYCHKKKLFKEFGFENNKTPFSLPIIAIVMAILIYMILSQFATSDKQIKENSNKMIPVMMQSQQYNPKIVYVPQSAIYQPQNNIAFDD